MPLLRHGYPPRIERPWIDSKRLRPDSSLKFLQELIEMGKVRSVIDQCYLLSESAEALRYVGKVTPMGK